VTNSIKASLLRADEEERAKEEHFKIKTPDNKIRWTDEDDIQPAKSEKRIVAFYFLKDCGKYRKDDVVGVEIQGAFCPLPGICRRLECGECPTIIKGSPPICDPCHWIGKERAEA
jgi:hypothetical protein